MQIEILKTRERVAEFFDAYRMNRASYKPIGVVDHPGQASYAVCVEGAIVEGSLLPRDDSTFLISQTLLAHTIEKFSAVNGPEQIVRGAGRFYNTENVALARTGISRLLPIFQAMSKFMEESPGTAVFDDGISSHPDQLILFIRLMRECTYRLPGLCDASRRFGYSAIQVKPLGL